MTQFDKNGYNRLSIIAHWVTVIAVLAMFFTHEKDYRFYHISMGFFFGAFFLWRALRRLKRGMTDEPPQPAILQILSQIVMYGMLACLLIQPLTGYLLPWTAGKPFPVFFFSIPSPIEKMGSLHSILGEIHDISGHVIMGLAILHFIGACKHKFIDKDDTVTRMIKPIKNGE